MSVFEVLVLAYNLLFSRNRNDDLPVIFSDVDVPSASIMVDALSVLSQFRRSAGWLYPVRPATPGTFERGAGRLILFGKNRVVFPDFTPPYKLEFFPRFGVGTYILSFYTGEPSPPPPVNDGWVRVLSSGREFKIFPLELKIKSRVIIDGSAMFDVFEGVVDGFILANDLHARYSGGGCVVLTIGNYGAVTVVSESTYVSRRADPSAVILPQ